ncbi:breast cancer type 2 susceptibility protein homolog [Culicoides brevitarsis]|uniref:breast cancer type 2 susceptibility protein homolog n=1 Tax=Culicoides brevitarsis TaxID=469753 RepID=UPI00307BAD36
MSKSKICVVENSLSKCDSAPGFTGFGLASGKSVLQNTKAVNIFNEILDEFPIETSTFRGSGLCSAKYIVGESSKTTTLLNDILGDFSKNTVVGESNSKTSYSKPIPKELEDNSFDNQISEVVFSPPNPVEKSAQENSKVSPLNTKENIQPLPKRVNQLRSPQVTKSPLIESPEAFMSNLINRQSIAASTPLMNKRGNFKNSSVRRTKLLNRLTEDPEELEKSALLEEMTIDMKEMRKISYSEQAKEIETKSEAMKAAMPGALFVRKQQENRVSWQNFVREIRNCQPSIEIAAKDLTFDNAKHFRFNLLQICSKSELESNKMYFSISPAIKIIPDEKFRIGFGEFFNTFMTLPGVNKKLISPKWFQHHYKMVVFKLFLYAKRAKVALGVFLTPQNIIEQIKFRYDLEIDKVVRSAIKRCIEGDDVPGKRLVLEVVDIQENVVTFSDGWYAIKTECDFELKKKIKEEKLWIGRRIITSGAEIKNLDAFCDPINMPDSVRLKIHYNSTRIAPVDAKLGYQRNPLPLLVRMNDIKIQGGLVSSVLAYVARVYPLIFQNKLTKEYYNEHQERRLCIKWEADRSARANKILEETTEEVKNDLKLTSFDASPGTKEVHQLRCAIEEGSDTFNINPAQRILLDNENERINNEIARRILNKSRTLAWQVSPCLRMCVLDVHQPKTGVILTIWDPKDVYNPKIKENQVFKITNLNPSVCDGALRLFSTNSTKFEQVHASFADIARFNRNVTQLEDISILKTNPPEFDEVDINCYVVFVQRKDQVNLVYVTNAKGDMVIINFCSSLEESGYSEIVKEGVFLSFQNLQWRSVGSSTSVIPTLFVKNLFTKITLLTDRKVSEEQKTFIQSFNGIDCNKFAQELSMKLGIELNAVKINESLGDTSRREIVETSVNQSNDNSLGTSKRKRLGNTVHTAKKKICTRSQTNIK